MGKPEHTGYWSSWMYNSTNSDKNYKLIAEFIKRPSEEFFDLDNDKFSRNNIAGNQQYNNIQLNLAQELKKWMNSQGDPGAAIDSRKEFNAQQKGQHFERKVIE